MNPHLQIFESARPRLQALAYRLLGSISDSQDLLQESFVRWQKVELTGLRQPEHYLTRMVTHAAIDQLRSARHRRESYTGPWLPEPWIETPADPVQALELADSLSMAFLLLLERLSPLERAVFLLRVVFDYEYAEIGELVDENPAYCRQLVHRAREHLHSERRSRSVDPERQQALLQAFMSACQQGELEPLQALLAQDAILYSDGGGKVRAALNPIQGADRVARFLQGVLSKSPQQMAVSPALINGSLGLLVSWDGQLRMTLGFDWNEQGIAAMYLVLNPDKLAHLQK
ncbi:MAG: RNA polymerase sigma-70 factor [Candidatus Sericytochromatia bacterium]